MSRVVLSLIKRSNQSIKSSSSSFSTSPGSSNSSGVFVHRSVILIGDVLLKKDANIWPNVVLRGDVNKIIIGESSNIQDGTVIHVTGDWDGQGSGAPTTVRRTYWNFQFYKIGDRVSVGHLVMLHGCTILDDVLIGMKAIVMDRAIVPSNTIIGAGSLVPPGKKLEPGYLYVGSPVKRVRELKVEELEWIK